MCDRWESPVAEYVVPVKGRACQAELSSQGPLNSNCSNVEWYVSDLQVCQTRLHYNNTVCNFLISLGLVMLCILRIQFQEVYYYNPS